MYSRDLRAHITVYSIGFVWSQHTNINFNRELLLYMYLINPFICKQKMLCWQLKWIVCNGKINHYIISTPTQKKIYHPILVQVLGTRIWNFLFKYHGVWDESIWYGHIACQQKIFYFSTLLYAAAFPFIMDEWIKRFCMNSVISKADDNTLGHLTFTFPIEALYLIHTALG